ncbi:hypothetical protein JCM19235_1945 [Vibrio maritimus]|uniref:Uncharacterized protein n=1 Tax=Vibrio maritimus TaxID=990268 RepID=A0A090SGD8_9VIBR|nr:hypothetical protein JCM19235_1945 [Vibrio maritimus]
MSIGYRVGEHKYNDDGVREIATIKALPEISVLPWGSNPAALVDLTSVKSSLGDEPSLRDIEATLREAGLSKKAAQHVIAQVKAAITHRDDVEEKETTSTTVTTAVFAALQSI